MNKLAVVEYLRAGGTLESLKKKPYCLKIQERGNLVLLKYNQIDSEFNEPICRECRGLILEKGTWIPVCFPFTKFFNINEPFADTVNGKLYIYQKIDGLLAKVWHYRGHWYLSSNGGLDAREVTVNNNINFYDLFIKALTTYNLTWDSFVAALDTNYTYMFELATQDSQVIIPYEGYHIFYLGQRNINTYIEEYKPMQIVENVKTYSFSNIDEILVASKDLPNDEEGYVVRDSQWHRVKVKNPTYFMLRHLVANGKPDFLKYYLDNNTDELLAYFPQYQKNIEELKMAFTVLKFAANRYHEVLSEYYGRDRHTFSAAIKKKNIPSFMQPYLFLTYTDNDLTWEQYTSDFGYNEWKRILEKVEKYGHIDDITCGTN